MKVRLRHKDVISLFLKDPKPRSLAELQGIFANDNMYIPYIARVVRELEANGTLVISISYPDGVKKYSLNPLVVGIDNKGIAKWYRPKANGV